MDSSDNKLTFVTVMLGFVVVSVFSSELVLPEFSTAGEGILPASLEARLASKGNAEDNMAAARLYQEKAHDLLLEAQQYELEAEAIANSPLVVQDRMSLKREALSRAAETARTKANKMQQLSDQHRTRALTMTDRTKSNENPGLLRR
jgi:hypothetical protein